MKKLVMMGWLPVGVWIWGAGCATGHAHLHSYQGLRSAEFEEGRVGVLLLEGKSAQGGTLWFYPECLSGLMPAGSLAGD
jgi:hypothetical protein